MTQAQGESQEITISVWRAYAIIFALLPVIIVTTILAHLLIWGTPANGDFLTVRFLGIFLLSGITHELLHGFAFWYFGGVPWKEIQFGVNWKAFALYVGCNARISARAYRITGALPGLVLGAIPALFGLVSGLGWFTWYGAIMLATSGGDFAILWTTRKLSGSEMVQRHPDKLNSMIVSPSGPTTSGV